MGSGFAGARQFGRFNHDPEASDVRPRYRSYGAPGYFGDAFYKDLAYGASFRRPSLYSKALKIG
jgi:hypothetical protein